MQMVVCDRDMKQKTRKRSASLLKKLILTLCVLAILTAGFAYARERRTVKVAFFPMDGYHILLEDGSFAGMDVDYLEELCRYAPWKIEYVLCESWDDALKKLEKES